MKCAKFLIVGHGEVAEWSNVPDSKSCLRALRIESPHRAKSATSADERPEFCNILLPRFDPPFGGYPAPAALPHPHPAVAIGGSPDAAISWTAQYNPAVDAPIAGTEPLGKLIARLPPAHAEYLIAMVEHYRDEFKRIEADGEANSESIAAGVHELIDEQISHLLAAEPLASRVVCRRGCSHCCYLWVTIDRHEAVLLLRAADALGIALDWDRIGRQAATDLRTWRDLPHPDKACVFLGTEGECRVYEHRPNGCRKYQVVDDPDLCDTAKHPGGEVGQLVSGPAEAIASAALVAFPGATSMARMLLRAKAGEPTN